MQQFSKYTAILLLAVFGYVLTPAALIHELHRHDDTHCIPGDIAVGRMHIHCKTLQIEAQVYTSPGLLSLASIPGISAPQQAQVQEAPSRAVSVYADLRAPPSV